MKCIINIQGTKERLYKSLEIRLRSDVPMAFCLSGGIDSNALVAIAKRVFDYEVHGFTIMNSDILMKREKWWNIQ